VQINTYVFITYKANKMCVGVGWKLLFKETKKIQSFIIKITYYHIKI